MTRSEMACCALAAFIVSQLLVALDWLRERVLGFEPALAVLNANAAWRFGEAAPPARPRGPFASPRRIALAFSGVAVALVFAYASWDFGGTHRPHGFQVPYLCTSGLALD